MAIIDRIFAKLTRAKEHIRDFENRLQEFYRTNPNQVSVREDPERGQRVYYAIRVAEVPDSLEAAAADAIHNLRVPLDHLAYQLRLHGSCPPLQRDRVYFPISSSASDYEGARKGKMKGVSQEAINAIDAIEPYKGGKGHALWQLQRMNNPDKHEMLILAVSQYAGFDAACHIKEILLESPGSAVGVGPPEHLLESMSLFLRPAGLPRPLKAGDELLREPLNVGTSVERKFAFQVSFYQPGVIDGEPAIDTLKRLADVVSAIVAELGSFLPAQFSQ